MWQFYRQLVQQRQQVCEQLLRQNAEVQAQIADMLNKEPSGEILHAHVLAPPCYA